MPHQTSISSSDQSRAASARLPGRRCRPAPTASRTAHSTAARRHLRPRNRAPCCPGRPGSGTARRPAPARVALRRRSVPDARAVASRRRRAARSLRAMPRPRRSRGRIRAEQRDLESAVPSNGSLDLRAAVLDEGPQVLASLRCHSSRLRRGNQHTREGPLRDRGRLHSPGTPASPALNMVRRSVHSAHTSSAANENWSATLR